MTGHVQDTLIKEELLQLSENFEMEVDSDTDLTASNKKSDKDQSLLGSLRIAEFARESHLSKCPNLFLSPQLEDPSVSNPINACENTSDGLENIVIKSTYSISGENFYVLISGFPLQWSFNKIKKFIYCWVPVQKLGTHHFSLNYSGLQKNVLAVLHSTTDCDLLATLVNAKINGRKGITVNQVDGTTLMTKHTSGLKKLHVDSTSPALPKLIFKSSELLKCGFFYNQPIEEPRKLHMYGLSKEVLKVLGINARRRIWPFVVVQNLPPAIKEAPLREVFGIAGVIHSIQLMSIVSNGSGGGVAALVEFDHPVEAVQAISLFNKRTYLDREITVKFLDKKRLKDTPLMPPGLESVGSGLGSRGRVLRGIRSFIEVAPIRNQIENLENTVLELNNDVKKLLKRPKIVKAKVVKKTTAETLKELLNNGETYESLLASLNTLCDREPEKYVVSKLNQIEFRRPYEYRQSLRKLCESLFKSDFSLEPKEAEECACMIRCACNYTMDKADTDSGNKSDSAYDQWSVRHPPEFILESDLNKSHCDHNYATQTNNATTEDGGHQQKKSDSVTTSKDTGVVTLNGSQRACSDKEVLLPANMVSASQTTCCGSISAPVREIDESTRKRLVDSTHINHMTIFENLPESVSYGVLLAKLKQFREFKVLEMKDGGEALVCFYNSYGAQQCAQKYNQCLVDDKLITARLYNTGRK